MIGGSQTWHAKRQARKRSMVLVDVRLLWILGSLAAGGCLYAAWVNFRGMVSGSDALTADELWRQQTVDPADWNHNDVAVWATGIGLQNLASALRRNGVDGALLLTLTERDIREDLHITNDLQVRRIQLALNKLRAGDMLPPSASRQGLVLSGINASVLTTGTFARTRKQQGADMLNITKKISLFRIWQKMSTDPPFMAIDLDLNSRMPFEHYINRIQAHVLTSEGKTAGRSISIKHSADNEQIRITLHGRNGMVIDSVRQLVLADPPRLFVLVGDELFFFPDDVVGEKLRVPLPSDKRSVELEVLSSTPRLMLVRNFLSPSECEAIKALATPLLEPSTVLKQGKSNRVLEQGTQAR